MVASGSRRSTYVYGLLVYVLHVISVHVLNGFIQYTTMQCACIHFLIKTTSVDFVPGLLMNSIPIIIITYEHFIFYSRSSLQ